MVPTWIFFFTVWKIGRFNTLGAELENLFTGAFGSPHCSEISDILALCQDLLCGHALWSSCLHLSKITGRHSFRTLSWAETELESGKEKMKIEKANWWHAYWRLLFARRNVLCAFVVVVWFQGFWCQHKIRIQRIEVVVHCKVCWDVVGQSSVHRVWHNS